MTDVRTLPNNVLMPEVERMLREGLQVVLRARGDSMLPFIRDGEDSLVLVHTPDLSVGDIVLARVGQAYVIHRVLAICGDRFTLMGDGNLKGTESCLRADVCGKVVAIVRGGRRMEPSAPKWRRRAALWRRLLPVRRWLLASWRRALAFRQKMNARQAADS